MIEPEAYGIWAPSEGIWSKWVKPVLFAHLDGAPGEVVPRDSSPRQAWFGNSGSNNMALVIDLPGVKAMEMGLSLVADGFRPIPLYNTSPGPKAVLDLAPIIARLKGGAGLLSEANLPADAPPAFLLDVERMRGKNLAQPGAYDNRWAVVPQDFPSANFLLARKIDTVVLVCEGEMEMDLAHVLLRWQNAGLKIMQADSPKARPSPVKIRKPSKFMAMAHRFSIFLGLRRNSAGGFGSVVPAESSSGGFG